MRRNIVGGLIAAVGLVLLGTASSFASGMGHKSMHTAVLNAPAVTPSEKAEASPEPSDTPKATPMAPQKLNMTGLPSTDENDDSGTDDGTMDDSSTKSPTPMASGEKDDSSMPKAGASPMSGSNDD